MKFNRKFLFPFFVLCFLIVACAQETNSSSSDEPEKKEEQTTPQKEPEKQYTYKIIDLDGNTIFPETSYTSEIDLTDATLKLTLLSTQIGWEDQNGKLYLLNTKIKNCSGNKIFKPNFCKTTPNVAGDIRLSDGKFVSADQITALSNQLAEPVSVVLSFTVNGSPCNLEMALEFNKCDFWTEDSVAYGLYKDNGYFTDAFPSALYDLCTNPWEADGRVIYQTWYNNISDGNTNKYPAFYFAENCTKGGFTDWYLPSFLEIDGTVISQNAQAITKSLNACGFAYLFENNSAKITYSNNPKIEFPAFWFFRIGYGKTLKDVWNSDGICHNPEYACAVRRF